MPTESSALLEGSTGGPYEKLDDNSIDVEEVKSEDADMRDRRAFCVKIVAILLLGLLIYFFWRWGIWQWIWSGLSGVNWAFWKKNNNDSSSPATINAGANETSNVTNTTLTTAVPFSTEFGACPDQNQNTHLSGVMDALFHLESVSDQVPDDFTTLPKSCSEAEKFCNVTSSVLATVTSQRCRSNCEMCDTSDVAIANQKGGGPPPCLDDNELLRFFLGRAKTTQNIDDINNCSQAKHLCDADTQYLAQGIQAACKSTCGQCDALLADTQKGPNSDQFCESTQAEGCYFGSNTGCCEGETCVPPAFKKGQTGYYEMKTRAKVISYCELSQALFDLDVTLAPHCYCLKAE